jgi:hypothetical protein
MRSSVSIRPTDPHETMDRSFVRESSKREKNPTGILRIWEGPPWGPPHGRAGVMAVAVAGTPAVQ